MERELREGAPKRAKRVIIFAVLMLLVGVLAVASGPRGTALFTDAHKLWRKVLFPLLRMTLLVSVGLFVGQLIEASGWTEKLARLVSPLMRYAHLTDASGAVFTTGFASSIAAQSMLMNYHREGSLTLRELVLTNLTMALPIYFVHFPTTLFIVVPLAGAAGLVYMALTLFAALLRTFGVLTASRLLLPCCKVEDAAHKAQKRPMKEILLETWDKFLERISGMLVYIVPVYLGVTLAAQVGLFGWLRNSLSGTVAGSFLPVESMGVVMVGVAAEFTSGFAAAGALLEQGAITIPQTVVALILGNVLAAPLRAVRHQLPYYLGIYTPRLGVLLIVLSQSLRVVSLIVVVAAYVLLFGI